MVQGGEGWHRQPLEGCARFGHEGGDIKGNAGAALFLVNNALNSQDKVYYGFYVLIGLRGQTNNEVELELFYSLLSDLLNYLKDILFRDALFNYPAQALGASFRARVIVLAPPLTTSESMVTENGFMRRELMESPAFICRSLVTSSSI